MSDNKRQWRLDKIREYSDVLTELGRRYDRLRWMAESAESTDIFLELAEAAGALTVDGLRQMATILAILFCFDPGLPPLEERT